MYTTESNACKEMIYAFEPFIFLFRVNQGLKNNNNPANSSSKFETLEKLND